MLDIGAEPEVFGGEVVEPGGQGGGLGPLAPEGVELRGDMPQLAVGLDEVIDTHLEVGRRAVGAGHLGVTRPWTRLGSGPGGASSKPWKNARISPETDSGSWQKRAYASSRYSAFHALTAAGRAFGGVFIASLGPKKTRRSGLYGAFAVAYRQS